jgi:hypothetical protein
MTTPAKFAEAWATRAIAEIPALETGDALATWIVENRYRLAECDMHAREAVAGIRQALKDRDLEIRAPEIRDGIG